MIDVAAVARNTADAPEFDERHPAAMRGQNHGESNGSRLGRVDLEYDRCTRAPFAKFPDLHDLR
jgi:hypothetical protein